MALQAEAEVVVEFASDNQTSDRALLRKRLLSEHVLLKLPDLLFDNSRFKREDVPCARLNAVVVQYFLVHSRLRASLRSAPAVEALVRGLALVIDTVRALAHIVD